MRDAEAATPTGVRLDAEQILRELAREGRPFTAETFRDRLGGRLLGSGPNSIGALIGAAARRGEIVSVGVETARRPEAHGRLLRVWVGAGRR